MVDIFGNRIVVGTRDWLPAGTYIDALVGRSRSLLFSPMISPRQRAALVVEISLQPPTSVVLAEVA